MSTQEISDFSYQMAWAQERPWKVELHQTHGLAMFGWRHHVFHTKMRADALCPQHYANPKLDAACLKRRLVGRIRTSSFLLGDDRKGIATLIGDVGTAGIAIHPYFSRRSADG